MPSKKPINVRGRRIPRGTVLLKTTRTDKLSLPPLFLTMKLRKSFERLLPPSYHLRLRSYFDTYGCLRCMHNNVLYGCNGFCLVCLNTIQKRLKVVDRKLRARLSDPSPDLQEAYLRPYNLARRLLADLVNKGNIPISKTMKRNLRPGLISNG
jgi:hypothetical protein